MISIQTMNEENGRQSGFLFVSECLSFSRVIQYLKIATFLSNKGLTYLTWSASGLRHISTAAISSFLAVATTSGLSDSRIQDI